MQLFFCPSLRDQASQIVDRAITLQKKESGILSQIEATLVDIKGPLARVKTPGLQDLFDCLVS